MANFEPVRGDKSSLTQDKRREGQMFLAKDTKELIFVAGTEADDIVFNADVIDGGDLDPQPNSET